MHLSAGELSSLYTRLLLTRTPSSSAIVGSEHYLSSRTKVEYEKNDVAQPLPRIERR
jgi:hypothetical protein